MKRLAVTCLLALTLMAPAAPTGSPVPGTATPAPPAAPGYICPADLATLIPGTTHFPAMTLILPGDILQRTAGGATQSLCYTGQPRPFVGLTADFIDNAVPLPDEIPIHPHAAYADGQLTPGALFLAEDGTLTQLRQKDSGPAPLAAHISLRFLLPDSD